MSTYVLMKVLESTPSRYEWGIRLLTLGQVDRAYDRLASRIQPGQRVLDLGCGTGALALRAAGRGASVKGIDTNPQMLEIAQTRASAAHLDQAVSFCEMGVAELASEAAQSYDVVISGLCFSELTESERAYALEEAWRLLRPGGLLLIADEVTPKSRLKRLLHRLTRLPLALVTYLLTQTTTHAVEDLPERVRSAGFEVRSIRLNRMETWLELVAARPDGGNR